MIITVTATTTRTSLKELIETAGHTFPNGNDSCTGLILQIDPATTENLEVSSTDNLGKFILSSDIGVGPAFIAYKDFRVRNTYLRATADTIAVNVKVEQVGG